MRGTFLTNTITDHIPLILSDINISDKKLLEMKNKIINGSLLALPSHRGAQNIVSSTKPPWSTIHRNLQHK
jgi:hypothetical protein